MKPKKWKVVFYVMDNGEEGHLDAQAIEVYLAVGMDKLKAPGVTLSKPIVQELKG